MVTQQISLNQQLIAYKNNVLTEKNKATLKPGQGAELDIAPFFNQHDCLFFCGLSGLCCCL